MKTYNIKLQFHSDQEKQQLKDYLILQNHIWNYISKFIHQKQCLNKKIIHDKTYKKCRTKFPKALAQMVIRAQHDAVSSYKSAISNGNSWSKIAEKDPFVKKKLSIRLDKRLYSMTKTDIKLSTLAKNYRISCSFILYDKINQMFSAYPSCDPLVFERDNEFFLSVTFETPEIKPKGTKILGIDVGEKRFITTSEGFCLSAKDLTQEKRIRKYLSRQLQKKKNKSHSARKKLKKSKRKERNFTNNYIHHVANKILEINSDVIVLENLSGINKQRQGKYRNRKRNQYPWRKLRDILTYKALFLNKRVETVNPRNTSKNDHRGIERGVRKGCRYLASDGKVFDADWNAAINIGLRYSSISKLPVSFKEPYDGSLNLIGRLCQEPIVEGPKDSFGKLREFISGSD